MPRRSTPLVAGEHFHLYNRGNNREPIFFERENYLFFLRRVREILLGEEQKPGALDRHQKSDFLEKSDFSPHAQALDQHQNPSLLARNQKSDFLEKSDFSPHEQSSNHRPVEVIAYALMPNHFHLIVRSNDDRLSEYMRRLSISFTRAMNERYGRVGSLFQGRFRAVHVDSDEYLLHLSRYLHLNPVQAGLVQRPEDWEYSSCRNYLGLRQGSLARPDMVLSQFPSPAAYQAFVEAYLPADREIISHLLFDHDR